jgi:hypothetical protein
MHFAIFELANLFVSFIAANIAQNLCSSRVDLNAVFPAFLLQRKAKFCTNPKVCNLWHKSGVRYMRTCQDCPPNYPWTGNTGISNSLANDEI